MRFRRWWCRMFHSTRHTTLAYFGVYRCNKCWTEFESPYK